MNTIEKIKTLEQSALRLEPESSERKVLLDKVISYTEEFLNSIYILPSYFQTEEKGSRLLDFPLAEEPGGIDEILNIVKENVDAPGLNPASRGHLGFIPGGGIYHSALADYMAAVTNRYAGVFFASPGAVRMENMMINWMSEIIGYPETSGGSLSSGGSIANLTAIVTARDAAGLKSIDFPRTVIYTTSQAHHSIDKALRLAGLKESVQRFIPLDANFRMDSKALITTIEQDTKDGLLPWLIIAAAGTTDTGAIDPLQEIGEIANKYKLWYHIDAAYGGFFMLAPGAKKRLAGIESSDSIIMDPHKTLFLPYGSGAVLVKDKTFLLESQHYSANYMQDARQSKEESAPADLSPELSKHFRGLRLWLPLKLAGIKTFRDALEEKLLLAEYFYDKLGEIRGIERGPFPDLSVVTFRYIPVSGDANDFNKRLVNEIQKDGRLFISSTMINEKFTLRLAVVSFRTHLDTIDEFLMILNEKIKFCLNN